MDKKTLLEAVKGMSREERVKFFRENKAEFELDSSDLESVTGGSGLMGGVSTTATLAIDENGNWFTSQGYRCQNEVLCN